MAHRYLADLPQRLSKHLRITDPTERGEQAKFWIEQTMIARQPWRDGFPLVFCECDSPADDLIADLFPRYVEIGEPSCPFLLLGKSFGGLGNGNGR